MTSSIEVESNIELKLKEDNVDITSSTELKNWEYFLSALWVLLINKKMPKWYKLELEEVYLKTAND